LGTFSPSASWHGQFTNLVSGCLGCDRIGKKANGCGIGKGAGGAFEEVSHEGITNLGQVPHIIQANILPFKVIALHTAIKELEDEIENPDSILNRTGAGKKSELGLLVRNCMGVLQQLNKLLIKYKSLGTGSKKAWDRLRWGTENLSDIREKLIAHTSSLTLFLTTLGTGSLGRIEKKLDELIADVQAGRREQTVLSIADDDEDESEAQWKTWKNELVDDGFTKVELEGHKHWIKARLLELIESGRLQEEPLTEENANKGRKSGLPFTSANSPKASNSTNPENRQLDFQATVQDGGMENSGILPKHESKQIQSNNILSTSEHDLEDEAEGWSEQIDASDSTVDTFPPTDSISNVGLNTISVDRIASATTSTRKPPLSPRNSPSRSNLKIHSERNAAAAVDVSLQNIPSSQAQGGTRDLRDLPGKLSEPRAAQGPVTMKSLEGTERLEVRDLEKTSTTHELSPISVPTSNKTPQEFPIRSFKEKEAAERKAPRDARAKNSTVKPDNLRQEEPTSNRRKNKSGRDYPREVDYSDDDSYTESYTDSSPSSDEAHWRPVLKPKTLPSPRSSTLPKRTERATEYSKGPHQKSGETAMDETGAGKISQPSEERLAELCFGPKQRKGQVDQGFRTEFPDPLHNTRPVPGFDPFEAGNEVGRLEVEAYGHHKSPSQHASGLDLWNVNSRPSQETYDAQVPYEHQPFELTNALPRPPAALSVHPQAPISEKSESDDRRTSASQPSENGSTRFSLFIPEFNDLLRKYSKWIFDNPIVLPKAPRDGESSRNRASSPPPVTIDKRLLALTLEQIFFGGPQKLNLKTVKTFDHVTGKLILVIDMKPGLKKGYRFRFKGIGDQEESGPRDVHFVVEEGRPIHLPFFARGLTSPLRNPIHCSPETAMIYTPRLLWTLLSLFVDGSALFPLLITKQSG
jgi:hypothetical protein